MSTFRASINGHPTMAEELPLIHTSLSERLTSFEHTTR